MMKKRVNPVDGRNRQCPPHWWIIDSNEVGHCKFCGAVKDFGSLSAKAMVQKGEENHNPVSLGWKQD